MHKSPILYFLGLFLKIFSAVMIIPLIVGRIYGESFVTLESYIYTAFISIVLGFLLETTQQLITISRSSDLFDFLANTSGIAAATLFFYFFVSGKKWELLF